MRGCGAHGFEPTEIFDRNDDWHYSYDAHYALSATGGWHAVGGSGSENGSGATNWSYTSGGSYGHPLDGGSLTGTWQAGGADNTTSSVNSTWNLGTDGNWTSPWNCPARHWKRSCRAKFGKKFTGVLRL